MSGIGAGQTCYAAVVSDVRAVDWTHRNKRSPGAVCGSPAQRGIYRDWSLGMTHATRTQPPLVKDWRYFIPGQPSIITAETWQTRNALVERHYPHIADLLTFGEDHIVRILMEVEQDQKPAREFPVGPPGPRPLAWLPRRSWLEWHLFRGIAPAARRDAVPTAVRLAVMERDGLTCQLCFGSVELGDVHLDHIKPWSRGGQHTVTNLRVTHSLCNIKRGAPDGT